jgi:gamma-glutamyl:cysteine ligase YbdK (ATP-grasp superfamily)
MKGPGDTERLALPPALLAEVQAAADEEHRPALDVLREVVERGLKERRWQRTLAYGQERARALGLTEADVPRLIAEVRQERCQEQSGA